jgi:hypothetical protein
LEAEWLRFLDLGQQDLLFVGAATGAARTVDASATRARANGHPLLVVAEFIAPPSLSRPLSAGTSSSISARQAAPSRFSY